MGVHLQTMVRLCVLVLGAILFSSVCVAQQTSSPCVFTEGEFYQYTQVMNCFHSILLTDDVKYTTLETLKRSLEIYAFYDIAHDSPDPNLPLQVNMQQGLEEIANRPYIYDMDFHNDLRYLYLQLNDAHTQYYLPTCYQNVMIRQGFGPVGWGSTVEDFQIRVSPYFPSDLVSWYQENSNIYLPDYSNYTIVGINGVDAYEYFMTYANTSVGMGKDAGTRFNFALTVPEPRDDITIIQYGYWQQRTHRNPFPETDSIVYTLVSPSGVKENVVLPWTFKALKTYTGQQSWLDDYYAKLAAIQPEYFIAAANEWDARTARGDILPAREHSFMEMEDKPELKNKIQDHKQELLSQYFGDAASDMTFELLANNTHLTFWQLSDNKTLVMYLDTMEPGKLSGFYPTLLKGFQAAADRGLTQFIIDLTNNGGGNICLGRALLAFLQRDGWAGEGQNWGPQDLPLSPFAEQMINSAVENDITNTVWSPAFYDNQDNVNINNTDTSYMLPGVPHLRGGYLRNYSKLLHIDGCGNYGYDLTPAVDFSPAETLIVTKGLCGSTCALFANHMNLYDDVRTVVLGGVPGRMPMQYTSFPGLQVIEKNALFGQFHRLKQNISYVPYDEIDPTDVVPRIIPTQADYRYCIREIYPPEADYDTIPMEFNFQQADYHLFNNELTANYPQYVWYQVLDFFSS